jgi:hypothetical protein
MPQQPSTPQQVMQQTQPYQYHQINSSTSPQQSSNAQPPFITSQRTGDKNPNKQNLPTSDLVNDPQITNKYTWQTIKRKRMRLTTEEATETRPN